jgi:hypothetical protein
MLIAEVPTRIKDPAASDPVSERPVILTLLPGNTRDNVRPMATALQSFAIHKR